MHLPIEGEHPAEGGVIVVEAPGVEIAPPAEIVEEQSSRQEPIGRDGRLIESRAFVLVEMLELGHRPTETVAAEVGGERLARIEARRTGIRRGRRLVPVGDRLRLHAAPRRRRDHVGLEGAKVPIDEIELRDINCRKADVGRHCER
jgi:hypothetical protein